MTDNEATEMTARVRYTYLENIELDECDGIDVIDEKDVRELAIVETLSDTKPNRKKLSRRAADLVPLDNVLLGVCVTKGGLDDD